MAVFVPNCAPVIVTVLICVGLFSVRMMVSTPLAFCRYCTIQSEGNV